MIEGVRAATADDLDVLVDLYRAALEETVEMKAAFRELDARPEPVADSFRADLAATDSIVLVGCIDDAPVGYAVVHMEERLPQAGGAHARVTDIYVDPEARSVGVGEELAKVVLAWAGERGAKSAEIRVVPGHRASKNFCEENGFTARILIMHRTL